MVAVVPAAWSRACRWMRRRGRRPGVGDAVCMAALLLAGNVCRADPALDVQRGKAIYAQRCALCHSLDSNGIGPAHRGVFGRRAGSVPGYAYSAALKQSDLVWNAKNLNAWLKDPEAMVPGVKMSADVTDPNRRALLISYLKTVSPRQ